MSQVSKVATASAATFNPRIARRIIRNYLRTTFIAACDPAAVTPSTLATVEKALNRVPGYKLVKSASKVS
jgi:hypothetical protein